MPERRIAELATPLELRQLRLELALEFLRPCAEARELRRAARGTRFRFGLRVAAVMTAQRAVGVQDERDVAVLTAQRRAARAAVQRRRDAAAVQEQDRLATALRDRTELGEQRRRERVAGLAPQVDDAHGRQ